jgi:hypothetical protein
MLWPRWYGLTYSLKIHGSDWCWKELCGCPATREVLPLDPSLLIYFRQFIDLLTGQEGKRAWHGLESGTDRIEATRVKRQGYDQGIVLIDTPGFDDTSRSDMEILQIIADWLQKT